MSLQRRRERYCIIHVWKILNNQAPNDVGFEFQHHQRLKIKAKLPSINKIHQMSVRTDYDNTFRVRAAQLWNLLPEKLGTEKSLDNFKVDLGRFLDKYPDTPPTPGTHQ